MKFFYTLLFSLFLSIIVRAQEYYDDVNMVDEGVSIVQKNEKYGVFKSGKITIPIKYDYINRLFPCHLLVFTTEGKYGILNYDGQQVLLPEYDEISSLGKDFCLIKIKKGNNYSLLDDSANRTDLYSKYNNVKSVFHDNLILVENNQNKQGLINLKGKEVISCQYDNISFLENESLIKIIKEGKQGLMDIQGKIILAPKYDTIEILPKYDIVKVSANNKFGLKKLQDGSNFSDQDYDFITLYKYKKVKSIENEILAERGGKTGLIDSLGKFNIVNLEDQDPQFLEYIELRNFILNHLKYPKKAVDNGIEGKVTIRFVIEKDGTLSNFSSVGGKLGYGLEEEVIRILKQTSGSWLPGVKNGMLAAMPFKVPVVFRLPQY